MRDDECTHWVELPAGTKHVAFEELSHLIALALWPDTEPYGDGCDIAYGGARINLEEELRKAVSEGRLRVLDPLTLGIQTFPVGAALDGSLVMVSDLRAFLVARGSGIGVRVAAASNTEVNTLIPQGAELVPIGLIAKDAAMRETPPVPGENDLRRDIRNAVRKTTEDDFARRLSTYLSQGKLKAINPLNGAPYDPELPHLDPDDPMWSLDNAEHETALEMLGQLKRTNEVGLIGTSLQSTAAHAAEAAARDARQARGFHTLREAAQLLADAHGLNARSLLQQLTAAFTDGQLVVRDPETQAPLKGRRLRDFFDWVTADDIDDLLSKAWRVSYRFPSKAVASDAAGAATSRPVQAQIAQEDAILARLALMNYTPLALPKAGAGRSGVRSIVRIAVGTNALFQSSVVFEKAWQRLRDSGRIADA